MIPYSDAWHTLIREGQNPLAFSIAREFAITAHGDQTYGDAQEPYIIHLDEVAAIVAEFMGKFSVKHRICAILHDVVEDTPVTVEYIRAWHGDDIADTVERVSNKPGVNRAARHLVTYPGIRAKDDALMIKLADRLAHTRRGESKIGMYRKEYPAFRTALWRNDSSDTVLRMWEELDRLNALPFPVV